MLLDSIDPGIIVEETQRIALILSQSENTTLRRAGDRMLECCSFQRVYKCTRENGAYFPMVRIWKCGKRGCLICDRYRCNQNIYKLFDVFKEYELENIKFITCTFQYKVRPHELREALDKLSGCLTKLFSRKMTKCITGGFKALEAVCDYQGLLNPHCHMLLHFKGEDLTSDRNVLRFIASDDCQDAIFKYSLNSGKSVDDIKKTIFWFLEHGIFHQLIWSALFKSVGLGAICKIESVDQGSAAEVAKYFTKTWTVPDEYLCDVFIAIKNKRLTTFFGDFKIKQGEEVDENPVIKTEYMGTSEDVIRLGLATDSPFELSVIHQLSKRGLIKVNVLDVPVLDSEGWRNLSEEMRIEILNRP